MKQIMYLKEDGFAPEQCTAELLSPVSTEHVTVFINGQAQNEQTLSEIRQRITKTL